MLALTVSVIFTSLIHHTFSFSSWTCNLTFFLSPSLLCHVGFQVLEACVKNCGHRFHVLVSTREFVEGVLVRSILPKNNPPLVLHDRVLSLIQVRDGIGTHSFSKSQSCVGIDSRLLSGVCCLWCVFVYGSGMGRRIPQLASSDGRGLCVRGPETERTGVSHDWTGRILPHSHSK